MLTIQLLALRPSSFTVHCVNNHSMKSSLLKAGVQLSWLMPGNSIYCTSTFFAFKVVKASLEKATGTTASASP